jgi:sugar lactone lactonase YvrE
LTFLGTGTSNIGLNQLSSPTGLFIDSSNNNLYVSDNGNYRVMMYSLSNTTSGSAGTVVAGTTNVTGNSSSLEYFSTGIRYLYVDSSQNLYVADTYNNRVMRWASGASSGVMVAGNGTFGSSSGQVYYPYGIWVDSSSNIFIAEYQLNRLTKWASGASTGITVAGISGSASKQNNEKTI